MYFRTFEKQDLPVKNCNRLLQEQKVAVIPGNAFGTCGEGFVRCSYAYSQDVIRACLEKIAEFIAQF